MAYEKQNFVDGQVLTAENLNHIENGIEQVEETVGNINTVLATLVDVEE